MPVRLSELLERIRPAGAPGAPSEGEQQRQEFDRLQEDADITEVLAGFEREATAIIAAANEQAKKLVGDAERRARQIRSELPAQLATVQAAAAHANDERDTTKERSIEAETEAAVTKLHAQGNALIPELQATAMNIIWSIMPTAPASSKDNP